MIKIIVNPQADKGESSNSWEYIESKIKRLGIAYEPIFTEYENHASHLARKVQGEGTKFILVVGGDGTISEVVNGIYLEDTVLGIIPTGSGNDFAKMIGIRSMSDGLNSLNSSCKKAVDVGFLNNDKYFINNLGIGIDACVVAKQKELKFKHESSYLISTLKIASAFRAFPIEVESPDFKFSGNVLSISIGNGQFHGGMFRLTPQEEIDDGLLDVCLIKEVNKLKRFLNIPKVVCGSHIFLKEVVVFKAKRISVSSPVSLPFHLDGELFDSLKELEIGILPQKLTFCTA